MDGMGKPFLAAGGRLGRVRGESRVPGLDLVTLFLVNARLGTPSSGR